MNEHDRHRNPDGLLCPNVYQSLGGPLGSVAWGQMRQAFRMSFDAKKAIQSKDVAATCVFGVGRIWQDCPNYRYHIVT
jgi:hypothetical protein